MRTISRFRPTSIRPTLRQSLAIKTASRLWRDRARSWDQEGSVGLRRVIDAVVRSGRPAPGMAALDLGCGSGQVTLPLARAGARVLAVDTSGDAIRLLEDRARQEALMIEALVRPIETLELDPGSLDLVISNYAFHHLRDSDKHAVLERAFVWLRPGGRLVIGDMMFGRGGDGRDREIIRTKVLALARRGPAGWWRIAKNLARFALRVQEKPLTTAAWEALAREVGFGEVAVAPVVAEACVLSARKPVVRERAGGRPDERAAILSL